MSLVVLACMLDVSGIGAYTELTAVAGVCILVFLYSTLLLPLYVLQPLLASSPSRYVHFLHAHLPLVCLLSDASLTAMAFASFLAAAYRCGSTLYIQGVSQHIPLCQSQAGYNVEASVGLEFVLVLGLAVSTRIEWRRVMAEPAELKERLISHV